MIEGAIIGALFVFIVFGIGVAIKAKRDTVRPTQTTYSYSPEWRKRGDGRWYMVDKKSGWIMSKGYDERPQDTNEGK